MGGLDLAKRCSNNALADSLRVTLPVLPLFRLASPRLKPATQRELVELAADVATTRECGARAVRSAPLGVSGHPVAALAMTRDAVDLSLARLEQGALPSAGLRRAATCGAVVTTAASLHFAVSAALVLSIAVTACPLART